MKKLLTISLVYISFLFLSPLAFAWNDYTYTGTNISWNATTHELKFDITDLSTPITLPIYQIWIRNPNTGNLPYIYNFTDPNSTECNNWTSCDFILSGPGGDISNVQIFFIQLPQSGPNWRSQLLNLNDYTTNFLPIPLLKQTSNPWQSEEYDSAHIWNPNDPTINAWGCAMTSAAMVFKYYGINKLPDGTNLDPGSLNTWLKNQPDGYVGTGWVNWLALARLSRIAGSINNIINFDALEYVRDAGNDQTQLTTDINNGHPDILEEPGHFIVGKGINDTTFDINDPYYNRLTLNDGYHNSFLSLGRYVPGHTDLSYIMLTADPGLNLSVKDNSGNPVGSSFIQSPITDPVNTNKTNSAIKIYYLPKPSTNIYTVTVSGTNGLFTIEAYLYDSQGNPKILNLSGFGTSLFQINFNKLANANSTVVKQVTFASVIQDIKSAQNLHLINSGLAIALLSILTQAQQQSVKHPEIAKTILAGGIKLLNDSNPHSVLISQETFLILLADFSALENSL